MKIYKTKFMGGSKMAVLMKGSKVSKNIKKDLLKRIEKLNYHNITPTLAILRIASKPGDLAYERSAVKKCMSMGIECKKFEYPESVEQNTLVNEIRKINDNSLIHGILLLKPLPKHINEDIINLEISPDKDMDCLNPVNVAKVFAGDNTGYAPCTPEAVIEILTHNNIPLEGKNIVIIGRSMVVGKPLSMLLLKKNATVTICHTRTRNIKDIARKAEILVVAAGKPKIIDDAYVSKDSIVIDVGINVDNNGKLCGDVNFGKVENIAAYITPVPGGVGTVTTSILARHVVNAADKTALKFTDRP